ncbi:MAG: hypothetical protein LPK26_04795 [Bacillaceae bacterium]|nr:hypothetical protein [Bacillaceae bacterium]
MKLYMCVPSDVSEKEDISLIWASSKDEVLDMIAEKEAKDDHFRDHVEEKGINFSLLEQFYYINDEYVFKMSSLPLEFSDTVKNGAELLSISCSKYADLMAEEQIREFFSECPEYGEQYIEYINSDEEASFSDVFYFYVCRRLINEGEWFSLEISEVDIPDGKDAKVLY